MSYLGEVRDGVTVLENGVRLPDGTRVRVDLVDGKPEQAGEPEPGSLAAELMKFAGVIDDLPPDLSRNHDHYLYGAPKK